MEHKTIGNTGVKIPPIIFGTSALGNLYTALSAATKLAIVRECISHVAKPVVFDSAGKYGAGLALEELGKTLKQLGVSAEDVVISNKLGWIRMPLLTPEPTFEKGVWMDIHHDARQNISYEGIRDCFEQGNALLGDYKPALVSVHDPDEYLAMATDQAHFNQLFAHILEAYKALASLKNDGIVKAVGVGAKDWKTIRLIDREVELDWVMFANSLTIYRHPKELLDFMEELNKKGVAIINSAVFHAGFLTGGDFFDYVKIKPDSELNKNRFAWRQDFFELCHKYSVLPANACVQFAMTPPGVISISLNTSNPARVKDNVESVNCRIPGEFWKEMRNRKLIDPDYSYLTF